MKDVVDNLTMCSLRSRQISNLTLRITAAQLKKNWVFDLPSSVKVTFRSISSGFGKHQSSLDAIHLNRFMGLTAITKDKFSRIWI